MFRPNKPGALMAAVPGNVTKVGLFVDADDATIVAALAAPLDCCSSTVPKRRNGSLISNAASACRS